ncbi:Kinesin-related protein 11 [Gossypium australe]|uniref:Kinesin-related protein 11 n=1 Tax=Gossypium australe TaxID=47621 RepID=A0A5B6WPP8_9ROSI|nr:Kinesin-related protein 11 [Gossypium australe]
MQLIHIYKNYVISCASTTFTPQFYGEECDLEKQETCGSKKQCKGKVKSSSSNNFSKHVVKRLLSELKVNSKKPIKMLFDNQATINVARNLVHHDQTKHIEIDQHFIYEKIENSIEQLMYLSSRFQTINILTKVLPRINFEDLCHRLCKCHRSQVKDRDKYAQSILWKSID